MSYGEGVEVTLKMLWVELNSLLVDIESPKSPEVHSSDYAKKAAATYQAVKDSGRQLLCDRLMFMLRMLDDVVRSDCPVHVRSNPELDGGEWFEQHRGN